MEWICKQRYAYVCMCVQKGREGGYVCMCMHEPSRVFLCVTVVLLRLNSYHGDCTCG